MITLKLRRDGDSYVLVIPKEEVEGRGWHEGQMLDVQETERELGRDLADDIGRAIDERWERNEPALRYLADR